MMLRIVGGEFGGQYIKSAWNNKKGLRPLAEVFREALFNSLGNSVKDAIFVDAFAGTGAVGIEALSRKARYVYFIEKDKRTARLIRENLNHLKIRDRATVIVGDVFRKLFYLKDPVNIIFFGPPYDRGFIPRVYDILLKWDQTPTLKYIIIQSSPREWLENPDFEVLRDLSRGDTVLKILRYVGGNR